MTIWMADAICWRIAFSGRFVAPIAIIVSIRDRASRGVLAWTVVSEPSWPVFMACSMSRASSPRTSPTTMRSGRIRRALTTSWRWRMAPLPFDVGRPRLEPRHVLLVQLQLGGVLDGDDALVLGDEARQHVEQRRLAGAGAAADQAVQLARARSATGTRASAASARRAPPGRWPSAARRETGESTAAGRPPPAAE